MKVIVGLGNPGKEYEKTRHNAGFLAVDEAAQEFDVKITTKKFNALIGETFIKGEKILFVKPQTYMNLSGESVKKVLDYYNLTEKDLCIVVDDLDLEVGIIRIREKGRSGGQKGIQNIIDMIGTYEFLRIKIGIGNNKQMDTKNYVLGKIDPNTAITKAKECIVDYCHGKSVLELMNKYN